MRNIIEDVEKLTDMVTLLVSEENRECEAAQEVGLTKKK